MAFRLQVGPSDQHFLQTAGLAFFEYSVDFKPNVSYTPPLPAEHNSNQTGDSYVELRSGLRSLEWKDEMQKVDYICREFH